MGERLKKFYEKNPDKRKKYRERYRSRKQERKKERTETDPTYNLVNRMRCRLWKYLKIHKIYKNNSTFEIIGCTPSELKEHIEKLEVTGEDKFSIIKNIPDVEINGRKLITILAEDLIKLLK